MSDEIPAVPAPRLQPSASYSFTMRLHLPQQGGAFARVAQAIAEAEAMLGAIDLVRVEARAVVRDVTVACIDGAHAEAVVGAVRDLEGVRVDSVSDRTFLMHKGGKIEVTAKLPLTTRDDLSMAYTPGVGRVSMAIHEEGESHTRDHSGPRPDQARLEYWHPSRGRGRACRARAPAPTGPLCMAGAARGNRDPCGGVRAPQRGNAAPGGAATALASGRRGTAAGGAAAALGSGQRARDNDPESGTSALGRRARPDAPGGHGRDCGHRRPARRRAGLPGRGRLDRRSGRRRHQRCAGRGAVVLAPALIMTRCRERPRTRCAH